MPDETPEVELARLKKEQDKALNDEVFVGLSPIERWQYEARRKRIQTLQWNAVARQEVQQRAWGRISETDTHQGEARQSYRSREENSFQAYADSKAESREVKRKKPDAG